MDFYSTSAQKNNVQEILKKLKEIGPASRREIQAATALSWGTVSKVTEYLVAEGYITATQRTSGSVGPKAEKLDIVADHHYFIGVDLDRRGCIVLLTDMKGRIIEKSEKKWEKKTYVSVMEELCSCLDDLFRRYTKKIEGIGFAVQGAVDGKEGRSVAIGEISGWKDVPLKQLLEERYGVEAFVAHDPDCLMKCETDFGVLKEKTAKDVLMVHYHHGFAIGMSCCLNGQIYSGAHGRAGEIGYTIVKTEQGTEEKLLGEYILEEETETEALFDGIGKSIAMANSFFDPDVIVLHMVGCNKTEQLEKAVRQRILKSSWNTEVQVCISSLPDDAKARGAALLAIEHAMDEVS